MTASTPAPAKRRKFPWWPYWLVFALIVLFMISPIFPVWWSEGAAREYGCTVNASYVIPCVVDGRDIGPELHATAQAGYYFLMTAPLGLLAIFIWLVWLVVHRILWGRRNRRLAKAP